jgi:protein-disulfide isomerase
MSRRNRNIVLGALCGAVAIAVALILVSVLGSDDSKSASMTATTAVETMAVEPDGGAGTTPAPAKVPGAAQAAAIFKGVPQRLNQLGNPKAPVTMIEFADLQCPYCKAYALDGLPTIVKDYVRPGKVKLVFSGMSFIGADSETALRAVYAAGLQGRLWNYLDLLYRNQGAENAGWVTDALLRSVGSSIPGLDTEKLMADMSSPEVEAALAAGQQQAQSANVNSTPTFFAGPTGQTLQHVDVTALTADAFRPTLDQLTK